jgi:hypothetical protein
MKNVSDKYCRENQNTLCLFNNFFLENRPVYGIARQATDGNTIGCMRNACLITKATDTRS